MQSGTGQDSSSGKSSGNPAGGPPQQGFAHPKMKVALIIWFALALSQAQFYFISLGQAGGSEPLMTADMFLLVGGVMTLLSQLVRHVPAFKGDPQKCFTGFIVALALSEVPGILGFLDSMSGGGSALWLQVMSVAAFALNFPTAERLGLLQTSGITSGASR